MGRWLNSTLERGESALATTSSSTTGLNTPALISRAETETTLVATSGGSPQEEAGRKKVEKLVRIL